MVSPSTSVNDTWDLSHLHLHHPHTIILEYMFKSNFLPEKMNFKPVSFKICQSQALEKFAKLPFDSSTTQIDAPFCLLHYDLWGSSLVLSKLGYRYFVLFIDQFHVLLGYISYKISLT